MALSSLKLKTYHGAFWSFIDSIGARLVQFVIGIILARLLMPEQFGLIAMLSIFMAIAQTLLDSGFSSALIQKKEITDADASSVFYFNVLISLVLSATLCLAAPWIAVFFDQPGLLRITQAMSLVVVINSFVVVQRTLLTRNVDFKTQAKVSLMAGLGSGCIGITMAYNAFGVWSLVAQQLAAAIFRAILLWLLSGWRPKLIFEVKALRNMFGFGSRLLFSGLLNQIFDNLYYVVIGKLFNPAGLGFYFKARTLADIPSNTLSGIVTRVTFPVFSSIQEDDARLLRILRKSIGILFFINAPVMIGLAVVAQPMVTVLLTEKWLPIVNYLQLLCVLGLLLPLHILNLNILLAKGRSDLFLRLEIIKKAMVVLNLFLSWRWGIIAIIYGQVTISIISYILNSHYTGKLLGYNGYHQLRDIMIYMGLTFLMGISVHLISYTGLPMNALLAVQIFTGVVVYLGLAIIVKPAALMECWEILRYKLNLSHQPV